MLAANEDLDFLNIAGISNSEIIKSSENDQIQYLKPVSNSEPSKIVEATVTTPTGSEILYLTMILKYQQI